jgi:hypothetical protein
LSVKKDRNAVWRSQLQVLGSFESDSRQRWNGQSCCGCRIFMFNRHPTFVATRICLKITSANSGNSGDILTYLCRGAPDPPGQVAGGLGKGNGKMRFDRRMYETRPTFASWALYTQISWCLKSLRYMDVTCREGEIQPVCTTLLQQERLHNRCHLRGSSTIHSSRQL